MTEKDKGTSATTVKYFLERVDVIKDIHETDILTSIGQRRRALEEAFVEKLRACPVREGATGLVTIRDLTDMRYEFDIRLSTLFTTEPVFCPPGSELRATLQTIHQNVDVSKVFQVKLIPIPGILEKMAVEHAARAMYMIDVKTSSNGTIPISCILDINSILSDGSIPGMQELNDVVDAAKDALKEEVNRLRDAAHFNSRADLGMMLEQFKTWTPPAMEED